MIKIPNQDDTRDELLWRKFKICSTTQRIHLCSNSTSKSICFLFLEKPSISIKKIKNYYRKNREKFHKRENSIELQVFSSYNTKKVLKCKKINMHHTKNNLCILKNL